MVSLAVGALLFGTFLGFLLPVYTFLLITFVTVCAGIGSAVWAGAPLSYIFGAALCVTLLAQMGFAASLALQSLDLQGAAGRKRIEALRQAFASKIKSPRDG